MSVCLAASPPLRVNYLLCRSCPASRQQCSARRYAVRSRLQNPISLAAGAGCNATPILDHPGSFPNWRCLASTLTASSRPHIGPGFPLSVGRLLLRPPPPSFISRCRRVFWACPVNPVASPLLAVSAVRNPAYLPEATHVAHGAGANQLDVAVWNGRQKVASTNRNCHPVTHHRRRSSQPLQLRQSPLTTHHH